MTSNPISSAVYAPLSPIEIDTSSISEIEDITTQLIGEDQLRQETRSLKNRGVDDIECIFFRCIFSNVSGLLVYFILPKVLEVKESEIFSTNFFRHYF